MTKAIDRSQRYYYYAVIIGWGFGILACIADISFSVIGYVLGSNSWLDIIGACMLTPFYITMLLSGFTYISRIIQSAEQAMQAKSQLQQAQNKTEAEIIALRKEKNLSWLNGLWTLGGALFGLIVSIAISIDPLNIVYKQDHFTYVAYFLCIIAGISWGSGLANRMIGKGRPALEKWGMRFATILGLGVSIALYYQVNIATFGGTGFVSVFTNHIGFMPIAAIFFPSFIGLISSVSDYMIKVGEFLVCHNWRAQGKYSSLTPQKQSLYQRILGRECEDIQVDRHEEYWGTVIGAGIGLMIGAGILTVAIVEPHLLGFSTSLGLPAAVIFMLAAFSGGAAAGSRTGNALVFSRQRPTDTQNLDASDQNHAQKLSLLKPRCSSYSKVLNDTAGNSLDSETTMDFVIPSASTHPIHLSSCSPIVSLVDKHTTSSSSSAVLCQNLETAVGYEC